MDNVVHINTKWCSIPGNRDAKKTKAMFLVAVVRPQWHAERQQHYDGKLGVWPFVEADPPLMDENACIQSTVVPIEGVYQILETVTENEVQTLIIAYVVPAIKLKMPSSLRNKPLFIQMDNQQLRLSRRSGRS